MKSYHGKNTFRKCFLSAFFIAVLCIVPAIYMVSFFSDVVEQFQLVISSELLEERNESEDKSPTVDKTYHLSSVFVDLTAETTKVSISPVGTDFFNWCYYQDVITPPPRLS